MLRCPVPNPLSDTAFDAALHLGYADALEDAPPWVLDAWFDYLGHPRSYQEAYPFLYHLLGNRGTPADKMPRGPLLGLYSDPSPIAGHTCAGCPFAYEKVIAPGRYICSQLQKTIAPTAWCIVPHLRGIWAPLAPALVRKLRLQALQAKPA